MQQLKKFVIFFLRQLAKIQLKKYHAKIIGVTGSVGKTTCVKAIYEILDSSYRVKCTPKSFNSEIGVPLSILNQESGYGNPFLWLQVFIGAFSRLLFNWQKYDFLILELGVDKPGDMQYLLSFIKPKIGVFLNAAAVHTEQFGEFSYPVTEIRKEKIKLIELLPKNGVGIIPSAETKISSVAKILTFGEEKNADLKILGISSSPQGLEFKLKYQGEQQFFQFKNVLGEEYAKTLTAAIAVGVVCQIGLEEQAKILKNFELPPSRMNLLPGIKNSLLIDSTYNASRLSMLLTLSALASFEGRRKIAVLGDMRELGSLAQSEHEKVTHAAVEVADYLVLVGPLMREFFLPEALKNGFAKDKIHVFEESIAAGEFVRDKLLKQGDVILLKGSQNTIYLEEAVKLLMKNPADASKLLCRQESYWLKTKEAYFKIKRKVRLHGLKPVEYFQVLTTESHSPKPSIPLRQGFVG